MSDTADPSEASLAALWWDRIGGRFLRHAEPRAEPQAVLVAGQPGAGKGAVVAALRDCFAGDGGCVVVDPVECMLLHPDYVPAARQDDATATEAILPDGLLAADHLLSLSAARRANLVAVVSFDVAESYGSLVAKLAARGYRVTFVTLAVSPDRSWQGVNDRYWAHHDESGLGRWVSRRVHDDTHRALEAALPILEERGDCDVIAVFDRDGRPLSVQDRRSGFTRGTAARAFRGEPESKPETAPPPSPAAAPSGHQGVTASGRKFRLGSFAPQPPVQAQAPVLPPPPPPPPPAAAAQPREPFLPPGPRTHADDPAPRRFFRVESQTAGEVAGDVSPREPFSRAPGRAESQEPPRAPAGPGPGPLANQVSPEVRHRQALQEKLRRLAGQDTPDPRG